MRPLKDLDKSALKLTHICPVLLDENVDSELIYTTIFGKFPPARLADTLAFMNTLARPSDTSFHDEMVGQSRYVVTVTKIVVTSLVLGIFNLGNVEAFALRQAPHSASS